LIGIWRSRTRPFPNSTAPNRTDPNRTDPKSLAPNPTAMQPDGPEPDRSRTGPLPNRTDPFGCKFELVGLSVVS